MGFDTNKDRDNDGVPDILEVARDGVNAQIQMREQNRKDRELAHNIENDKKDNEIKEKALKSKTTKANSQ